MSELPAGVAPAEPPAPRESALGILLRRDGAWRVLLGVRSRQSPFMPGHHAFPGGRLEAVDRPAEPGAHARCVAREIAEETGIELPVSAWRLVGERTTPPMFPVRYRTEFFAAALPEDVEAVVPIDAENERFEIAAPAAVLEAWGAGRARIPPPVLPILRAIASARPAAGLDEVTAAIAAANAEEHRAPRIEFVPGVWMLPVRTATLPPASHTNVWLAGGTRFVVVDPGTTDPADLQRLRRVIERRAADGSALAAVLLTHHHRDHAAGAPALARELGVPLRAHPLVLERLADDGAVPLRDGEVLDLGGEDLVVHASPGHAPGHLSFLLPRRQALIAGDMISGLSTILIDPADGGDMGEYLATLDRLRGLDCRTLLPGHGPPLPLQELDRVLAHRRDREGRVLAALSDRSFTSLDDAARQAYADTPGLPPALMQTQTLAHLLLAEREGRVLRQGRRTDMWRLAAPERVAAIREVLTREFAPLHLELHDDSAKHAGHAGAAEGGHFRVVLVSRAFEGQSRLEQHRRVHAALREMFGREIHALVLDTRTPAEWSPDR